MSRWRLAGVVGGLVALLAGCATEQPAQDMSTSLPVAALLAVVPLVVGGAAIRGVLRGARRWPPAEDLDGRQGVVIFPLAAVVVLVLFAWMFSISGVAFGYREVHDDIFSWREMTLFAVSVAVFGLVVVVVAFSLGLGVWRARTGAVVTLVVATVALLVGQAWLILGTDEPRGVWIVAVIEVAYLLVLVSLIVDPPRAEPGDG
ncbi:MAG TPA: hypothetical protein VK507_13320 [Iamia sp.]|nr:hypothetical protein [Iamia sp.]